MVASSDFIIQALSPRIVIFADEQVDRSCELNGCKSLDELFKPWQSAVQRVPVLSSTLSPTTHSSFMVRFTSHSTLLQSQLGGGGTLPYSPEIVVDIVSNLVHSAKPDKDNEMPYEILRDVLLASNPVDGPGTFNHPVCQLFAISTSSPAPLEVLGQIMDKAKKSPVFSTKPYVESHSTHSQRSYLLVHDVSKEGHDLARAHEILQQVKQRYGPHCSLLVINSLGRHTSEEVSEPPVEPCSNVPYHVQYAAALNRLSTNDPFTRLTDMLSEDILTMHSEIGLVIKKLDDEGTLHEYAGYLGKQDINNIRDYIRVLTVQSIIPWMEARVREWSEIYLQTRKGFTGRLFGAGRKLFGSNGLATAKSAKSDTKDYKSAISFYESIRQDYSDDGNMALTADVVVMYGLSCLLNVPPKSALPPGSVVDRLPEFETIVLVQQAMERPLHSSRQFDLLRNLLSFLEIFALQHGSGHSRAFLAVSNVLVIVAKQVAEIFGAILLQKAAAFDILGSHGHARKRTFHLVLAAWRYEHTGHVSQSWNCIAGAPLGPQQHAPLWRYSQDFVEYTLGRQARALGDDLSAVKHFSLLLDRGLGTAFQSTLLQDFCLAHQTISELYDRAMPPVLVFDEPRVMPLSSGEKSRNREISATLLKEVDPRIMYHGQSKTNSSHERTVYCDEPFQVLIAVTNPTNAPIELSFLNLSMIDEYGDNADGAFNIREITNLVLLPLEIKTVMKAKVASLTCRLAGTLECVQRFPNQGQGSMEFGSQSAKAVDKNGSSMTIHVAQPVLSLDCRFPNSRYSILNGESIPIEILLENRGDVLLTDIVLSVKLLDCFCPVSFVRLEPDNGILLPHQTRMLEVVLCVRGEGTMATEIVLEFTQQDNHRRDSISHTYPIFVQSSIASTISTAFRNVLEYPPTYSPILEFESLSCNQNFYLLSSTLAYREPYLQKVLRIVLRMHQLYRHHSSLPVKPPQAKGSTCSNLCLPESLQTCPVVLSKGDRRPPHKPTAPSFRWDERSLKSGKPITILSPEDICLAQNNIVDISLLASTTDDFSGLAKQISLEAGKSSKITGTSDMASEWPAFRIMLEKES